jgi:hypothetical protein
MLDTKNMVPTCVSPLGPRRTLAKIGPKKPIKLLPRQQRSRRSRIGRDSSISLLLGAGEPRAFLEYPERLANRHLLEGSLIEFGAISKKVVSRDVQDGR